MVSLPARSIELGQKSPQSAETAWFLTIAERAAGDAVVLDVAGRIGSAAAPQLTEALSSAGTRGSRIVLELSGVDYISSAGIAAIEHGAARLAAEGKTLVIRGGRGATALCLDLARVPHQ